jgi:hypothetical protein
MHLLRFSAVSKSYWSRLPADIVTITGHIVRDKFCEIDWVFWSKWKLPHILLFQNWFNDWSFNLTIYKCNYLKPFEDAALFLLFYHDFCCFRFLGIWCHYFHSFNFEFSLINVACSSMLHIYIRFLGLL